MLLTLLVAQLAIVNSAPKISAAEALAILSRVDSPSNWTNRFICSDCDGPHVTIVPYHPNEGPFGRFPVYELPPLVTSSYYGSWNYGASYYSAPYASYYRAPYASTYSYGTNINRSRTTISPRAARSHR